MERPVTRIFHRDKFKEIDPDKAPSDLQELDGFLSANKAPKCFAKSVGGWYKMQHGRMLYVNRVLYTMSFKDWLEVALNKNFTSNIK